MSYVALDWMMEKVAADANQGWGLTFDAAKRREARLLANVHDKLYDSRAGLAAYYRYRPRNLAPPDLEQKDPLMAAKEPIRIHESVFDRIHARTLEYNPGNLPCDRDIEIVATSGSGLPDNKVRQDLANNSKVERRTRLVNAAEWVEAGKGLHMAVILLTLLIVCSLLQFGFVSVFPQWELFRYVIIAAFAVGIGAMTLTTKNEYHLPLGISGLVLLAVTQIWPDELLRFPIKKQFEVWDEAKEVLAFLLPDQLADTIVQLVSRYPWGAILVVIALVAIIGRKVEIDRELAKANEYACETVRDPRLADPAPDQPVSGEAMEKPAA